MLLHQATNENAEVFDEENHEMESTEKKLPTNKALLEAVNLIERFALFQNDDLTKQLRKYTAKLNDITTNTSFKPI